jgi:methylmalonyl-CoA/ethylmalonyl-CoA epimerase
MAELEFWYHHVGVSVPDMDAAIAWYDRVLGFKLERRFMIGSIPAEIAILKHGALHVELFKPGDPRPLPPERREPDLDARTHGNKHVAFSVSDVDAFADELRRRGADIVWVKHFPDGRANIFIRDNSGNLIEFLQMPKESQFIVALQSTAAPGAAA